MVAFGYQFDRFTNLSCTSLFAIICVLQIWASRRMKTTETKYFIHYWNLVSSFFLILAFIDQDAVYGIWNYLTFILFFKASAQAGLASLVVVIVNHFRAHYLSLKKELPSNFVLLLSVPIMCGSILIPLGDILTFTENSNRFIIIQYVNALIEVVGITFLDLVGYTTIRKLLIEAIRLERPQFQASPWFCPQKASRNAAPHTPRGPSQSSAPLDYEKVLQRIWKFHALVVFTMFVYLGTVISGVFRKNWVGVPIYPQPDSYTFTYEIHAMLPGLIVLCWWAWIPLTSLFSDESHSHSSLNDTSKSAKYESGRQKSVQPAPSYRPSSERESACFLDDQQKSSMIQTPSRLSSRRESVGLMDTTEEDNSSASSSPDQIIIISSSSSTRSPEIDLTPPIFSLPHAEPSPCSTREIELGTIEEKDSPDPIDPGSIASEC